MGFNVDKLGKVLGSGLLVVLGPQLIAGMLTEWVKTLNIRLVTEWVINNRSLWENIPPEWQQKLKTWGPRMGDMQWFTVEFLLKECYKSNPSVVSLFINWPEAGQWLAVNLEDLKTHVLPQKTPKVANNAS